MPPRDDTITRCLPDLADHAFEIRRKAREAGAECGIGLERDDNDVPLGVCFGLRVGGKVLGSATLDEEGLSFWVEGHGGSDDATDAEFEAAIRGGVAVMKTGIEPLGRDFAKVWDENIDTLYES